MPEKATKADVTVLTPSVPDTTGFTLVCLTEGSWLTPPSVPRSGILLGREHPMARLWTAVRGQGSTSQLVLTPQGVRPYSSYASAMTYWHPATPEEWAAAS
jgi:hypothetical protein